jgi:bifunctional DNase/RNase
MSEMQRPDEGWVEMEVKGLLLDPASETPVLLLQATGSPAVLPIWIGQVEANAIAMALEGMREVRPMTHDLMHDILHQLAIEIERVEIWPSARGHFTAGCVCARARNRSRWTPGRATLSPWLSVPARPSGSPRRYSTRPSNSI